MSENGKKRFSKGARPSDEEGLDSWLEEQSGSNT